MFSWGIKEISDMKLLNAGVLQDSILDSTFFNCYLAGPRPTLGYYQGAASLTQC